MSTVSPIADVEEYTPTAADWAEFAAWADAQPDPEPTPEDFAWDDGYHAGSAGEHDGPTGLVGTLRDAWWAGFTAGFAAASAASAARAAAYRSRNGIPPEMADWIAATRDVTGWPA